MKHKNSQITIAGIDEAGRGPLAGPVVAAAVILDPQQPIFELTDSKILTSDERNELYSLIQEKALAWAIGRADWIEIDKINILQATYLSMHRAFAGLQLKPQIVYIDGAQDPKLPCDTKMIVKGDLLESSIGAASILAKVTRDREMIEWDKQFPQYGFAKHKGYATAEHREALKKYGPCLIHRHSFSPVRSSVPNDNNS